MDLSKLSDADLMALQAGDLSKVSDAGLRHLQRQSTPEPVYDPTEGMSTSEKFLAGMGKAFSDVGRGAGQLLGIVDQKDVDESKRLDRALMKTTPAKFGNVTGNVVAALPTAFIPGVNTVTGGVASGALLGALQPVGTEDSRAKNMAIGGIAGGVLPVAVNVGRAAKAALYDPIASQDKIIAQALLRFAGKDANQVVNALNTSKAATPGVRLTAGQASKNEGIAALEDALIAQNPAGELARTAQSNRTTLANALRGIAQTPEAIDAAKAARSAATSPLYNSSKAQTVNLEELSPEIQQSLASLQNRIPDDVVNEAKHLAKLSGVEMNNQSAIQGMQWVKKAIDSKIGQAKASGNNELFAAYTGLKNDFLDNLGQISPEYAQANQLFQQMSRPINQMQVGQHLTEKLVPATAAGSDVPAALNYSNLAKAMLYPDQVAQRATGFKGATLEGVLTPEQLATVKGVTTDASTIGEAMRRGGGAGSATARRFATGDALAQHFQDNAPIIATVIEKMNNAPFIGPAAKTVTGIGSIVGNKIQSNMMQKMDELLANNPQAVAAMIQKELQALPAADRQMAIKALPQSLLMGISVNSMQ